MASLIPFEFKKLLRRQSVFGAIVVVLLAIGGLFYQHFLTVRSVALLQIRFMDVQM